MHQVTPGRLLLEAFQTDRLPGRGTTGFIREGRRGVLSTAWNRVAKRGPGSERRLTGEQFVENGPQAIDITHRGDGPAPLGLLR